MCVPLIHSQHTDPPPRVCATDIYKEYLMKKIIVFLLFLAVCCSITACATKSLPEITALESMTDTEITVMLIGRNRQELIDQWGEPLSTDEERSQDVFHLNPEHLPDQSHKIIVVYYDDNFRITKVSVDYCN